MRSTVPLLLGIAVAVAACDHPLEVRQCTQLITSDAPGGSGGTCVKLDKDGNTILAGVFENTFTLAGQRFTSSGRHDVFLAKLDPQFHVLWIESFGGPGNDFSPGLAVDDAGNITLACDFENMLNLTSRFALYCDGHGQALIRVGPDGAGQEVVAVQARGGIHEVQINGLCTGSDGAVHAIGNFTADTLLARTFHLDGTEVARVQATAMGTATLFTLHRGANGVTSLQTATEDGSVYALSNRIAAAPDGGSVIAGVHKGRLVMDGQDVSGNGIYVAHLDAQGKVRKAVRAGLQCTEPGSLSVEDIRLDGKGHTRVLLSFQGDVHALDKDLRWDAGRGKDALLLDLDPNDEVVGGYQLGTGDDLFARSLAYDASQDRLLVSGYHHGALMASKAVQLGSDGKFNAFVIALGPDGDVRSATGSQGAGQQFLMAMDARNGRVSFAGTYFGKSRFDAIELPMPAGRIFTGTLDMAAH